MNEFLVKEKKLSKNVFFLMFVFLFSFDLIW